jgi:hypothetical protein
MTDTQDSVSPSQEQSVEEKIAKKKEEAITELLKRVFFTQDSTLGRVIGYMPVDSITNTILMDRANPKDSLSLRRNTSTTKAIKAALDFSTAYAAEIPGLKDFTENELLLALEKRIVKYVLKTDNPFINTKAETKDSKELIRVLTIKKTELNNLFKDFIQTKNLFKSIIQGMLDASKENKNENVSIDQLINTLQVFLNKISFEFTPRSYVDIDVSDAG